MKRAFLLLSVALLQGCAPLMGFIEAQKEERARERRMDEAVAAAQSKPDPSFLQTLQIDLCAYPYPYGMLDQYPAPSYYERAGTTWTYFGYGPPGRGRWIR